MQDDGKLLLSGQCLGTSTGLDACIARLNPDGSLDAAHRNGGKSIYPTGDSVDTVTDSVLQPDGKLLVAGHCYPGSPNIAVEFCILRLEGGPHSYRRCSLDLIGDGNVLSFNNLLISTRTHRTWLSGRCVVSGRQPSTAQPRRQVASLSPLAIAELSISFSLKSP